jgi:transcriptional regulator with XRE-family HTH domain
MMIAMDGFGGRLHSALELAGIDPRAVAKHCDIDPSSVNKWLHDERIVATIHAKNLYCVADLLKVSARWLATGEGEPRPQKDGMSYTAARVARSVDDLNPQQQLLLTAILEEMLKN